MTQFSNVIIHGGTINSAQGDLYIGNRGNRHSVTGLHILGQAASLGAIHDSAERCPPPNCHPNTRKAVREIILDWIHNENSVPFFWLYGPAGAGKTAILQAIAEFLCRPSGPDENFGGSFFFSRGEDGRDQGHFLFSTLAYQLALKVPGLRQQVNRIMEANPTLQSKTMAVQLQTLIVDAFQSLPSLPQHPYLMIIDGLNECQDNMAQQSILQLLCKAITVYKLPFRFLIASRPESHIRVSFDQEPLCINTRRVVLDETFNPGRDIEVFLQDGFADICANNSRVLSHAKQLWPEEGIIDLLVQRSSGQFIYAATVLKFVGADFCSPTKQLALILEHDSTAFSDLDQLYTQILSVYPSTVNITRILGIIIAFEYAHVTLELIEDIFGMDEGELKRVLQGLSSLIAFVGDKNGEYLIKEVSNVGRPYFVHASFVDYLVDSSRSGPFHVNKEEYRNQIAVWSFALITKSIRSSWRIPATTRFPHRRTWDFLRSYLPKYFIRSPGVVKEAIMTDISGLVQEFSTAEAVDVSLFAMHCLFGILQIVAYNLDESEHLKARFMSLFEGYQTLLDLSFHKSRDINDILKFLPGFVVQHPLTMQGMAGLYGVKMELLERLVESTNEPLQEVPSADICYILRDHLSRFLQHRDRSRLYCHPILYHISICHRFLVLLDGSKSNASDLQLHELSYYVRHHFYDHLCAATTVFVHGQKIPDDHPAVQILNDLESTTYNIDAHLPCYDLAQGIVEAILRWADMLNCHLERIATPILNLDWMNRVYQLTNKIYREILCIKRHGSVTIISTMGEHDHFQVNAFSRTPHYETLVLCWELLSRMSVEEKILSSFTLFITTPELSGSLHIRSDDYHTQITEYSLETIFRHYNKFRPSPFSYCNCFLVVDWCFKDHIFDAHPSEMIFHLLQLIPWLMVCDSTALNLLEIIIKWLEGLGSERPNDLYDRFLREDELFQLELQRKHRPLEPVATVSEQPISKYHTLLKKLKGFFT